MSLYPASFRSSAILNHGHRDGVPPVWEFPLFIVIPRRWSDAFPYGQPPQVDLPQKKKRSIKEKSFAERGKEKGLVSKGGREAPSDPSWRPGVWTQRAMLL
ncbi:hypothetical protein GN956_G25038 [Arapaima gigas]